MRVINVRNVHQALPEGLRLLRELGVKRTSRNGPVIVAPCPVTTVYARPTERVLFWPQRDANPFLHLYESLWMLAGRNDVAPLLRFTKQFAEYSDDGVKLHGAYGYRWRKAFGIDQLDLIARRLQANPDDRRMALQMWDVHADLGSVSKDVPCNMMVAFQISHRGELDMTVFNRSNDIIWGLYGANAVHFSMLQEYMAVKIGVGVGVYSHVSNNFHAYNNDLYKRVSEIPSDDGIFGRILDPYSSDEVDGLGMVSGYDYDTEIMRILKQEPFDYTTTSGLSYWGVVILNMFKAHRLATYYNQYREAIGVLDSLNGSLDWVAAGLQWLRRRVEKKARDASGKTTEQPKEG